MVIVIVYELKSRVIVCRAVRCLRPCDRLSSPLSVILPQLRVRSEKANSYDYSLPAEAKSHILESHKMLQAL